MQKDVFRLKFFSRNEKCGDKFTSLEIFKHIEIKTCEREVISLTAMRNAFVVEVLEAFEELVHDVFCFGFTETAV